ncbi:MULTISPECIES: DUF4097 family beta strand repeat-containing protein [Amycolatopsis]|uniref:DUF4097 domain-containing protein n=1 Tax=Amycolatopsis thermalba TaxID=944492 RepID=A0ABY4NLZ5_9PSEU|nr:MULTISPECIES: DUF4097 family beta strand repeat-containing protein [Amycolatopsis]OXM70119.1 hypothetical protein CF166_21145 [Amycolatopsis sp. KNN50.9b]UQS21464.1 DUF4097 domain-containing protein [Amycolatopsis thermalba]
MRKPALAIGGIALIVAGVGIALNWDWWRISERAELTSTVTQPISAVHVDNNSGDVRIRIEDTATTSVNQVLHYDGDQPGQAFRLAGAQLVLDGCGNDCTVDYEVVVPRGTTVTGEVRSGDFTVYGAASVDLAASSGDIRVQDITGPVTTRTKSGSIDVGLATAQNVHAEAQSGDIRVVVPADRYRVAGETKSGDRSINVVQDPAAPHLLDVRTSSGDATVTHA